MLNSVQTINHYKDRFINYSGISLKDQFYFFHMSEDINEEIERGDSFEAGVLQYDLYNNEFKFASYPPNISFESYTPGKTVIHIARLDWENRKANLKIYKFDCNSMQANEVYRYTFVDKIAENTKNSALWRLELYSLDDDYLLINVPDLNPFSKKNNYGFSNCLLIDIKSQQSYIIPQHLNDNDSFLNVSHLERFNYNQKDYLIIHTGRISLQNKKKLWNQKEIDMNTNVSHQTKILIPLKEFVASVKEQRKIQKRYIIDQCGPSKGYVNTVRLKNYIYFHKFNFITNSSEIVKYNVVSEFKESLSFTHAIEKVIATDDHLLGILINEAEHEQQVFDLETGTLLLDISLDQSIKFFNNSLIILQHVDEQGYQCLEFYNSKHDQLLQKFTGSRTSLFILNSKNTKYFLVHID